MLAMRPSSHQRPALGKAPLLRMLRLQQGPGNRKNRHMRRRICRTRSLKKKQKFSKHAFYKASQLFNGTVHFLNVNFGGATVSSDDYKTAVTYTSLAMV